MIETRALGSKEGIDPEPVKTSVRFDWIMALTIFWVIVGLNMDVRAHIHQPEKETFFSPWHGIMYSGFAVNAAVLYVTMLRNQLKGHRWFNAVPRGYELSLIGMIVFIGGAMGDMAWHTIIGVENGVEALYSPTHLALATGGAILISGPIRSMWRRSDRDARDWRQWFTVALSMSMLITLFGFFSNHINPISHPIETVNARFYENEAGGDAGELYLSVKLVGVIVSTTVLAVVLLVATRRWKLLPGTIAFMLGLHAVMMGFVTGVGESYPTKVVLGIVAAGFVLDALRYVLDPSVKRIWAFRAFAALIPLIWSAFYFAAVESTTGIPWTVDIWAGTIVQASVIGWALSYLVVPPKLPSRDEAQS